MATLEPFGSEISTMISEGKSYGDISQHLSSKYGLAKGVSPATVRRFCTECGMSRRANCVDDTDLQRSLQQAVTEVGPSYGRKMMKGYLAAQGCNVGEVRLGSALRQIHAPYHKERAQGVRGLNPIPYSADYFGHKLHLDQNEKLVMFGVTHVLAVDGFSGQIVGHVTMPIKNNCVIYDSVYRPATLSHGMWDQLRVDHGREFFLCLYMQQRNCDLRYNRSRTACMQTESTKNHRVERLWVEVNQRVNFPIKTALVDMIDRDLLHLDDGITRFCVSNMTIQMSHVGLDRTVTAWNNHPIPGHGVPNELARQKHTGLVQACDFPPSDEACDLYWQDNRSRLTECSPFAANPFSSANEQEQCAAAFAAQFPSVDIIFSHVVNRRYDVFQDALTYMINLTHSQCD